MFHGKLCVGYIRLRFGRLEARCDPSGKDALNGETVYAAAFQEPFLGQFRSDSERIEHLGAIKKAMRKRLLEERTH